MMITTADEALRFLGTWFTRIEIQFVGHKYTVAAGGEVQRVSGEGPTPDKAAVDAAREWAELLWGAEPQPHSTITTG